MAAKAAAEIKDRTAERADQLLDVVDFPLGPLLGKERMPEIWRTIAEKVVTTCGG